MEQYQQQHKAFLLFTLHLRLKKKNAAFPQTTIHSTVKQASQSVCFNDQPQATLDRS